MSLNISKKISPKFEHLLENSNLTEVQKSLWVKYLSFLDAEQTNDLCEIIEKDKESFDTITVELETNNK